MSASKLINNVIIIGGISGMGVIAYLLFKKKPAIVKESIPIKYNVVEKGKTAVNEEDWIKAQRKLCADFIINKSGLSSESHSMANIRSCNNIQEKNELNEQLIDLGALSDKIDFNKVKSFDALFLNYFTQDGNLKANTCFELDLIIKKFGLAEVQLSAGSGLGMQQQISKMANEKFKKFNCRDKIEAVRTRNLIDLQSKGSIKAEESIVGKGFVEQKTYIILGTLVLLTGFYIVVKK